MDLQQQMTSFAMLGATWVMWLLVGLSIVSLAVVLERAVHLLRSRIKTAGLREEVRALFRAGRLQDAQTRLARSRSCEAKILSAALEGVDDGPASAEERLEGASETARLSMEKRLGFLATVGSNAPFVGLLGTVIGVIGAFQELNSSQGQVTSGLMSEVGEALVATAIGLLVALPAVAFFNLFQRIIRARLTRARTLGRELLAHLKAQTILTTTAAAEATSTREQ